MRSFSLHPARSVEEAITLLEHYGEDTQLLSGGTSLMVLGTLGLSEPEHVVDLAGLDELRGIAIDTDGCLRIGAMTTLREIETSSLVHQHAAGLAEAVKTVATVRIRNQATIGGNLAHSDPAQDAPPMLIALQASVEARGKRGSRRFNVEELSSGYMETTLEPGEVLTRVLIPPQPVGARCGYFKFLPRTQDDFATISVAARVNVDRAEIGDVRIVFGAAAQVPVRASRLEAALTGLPIHKDAWHHVTTLASQEVDPGGDDRGSADYKRAIAAVCVSRLLTRLLASTP